MIANVSTYIKPLIGNDNALDVNDLKELIEKGLVTREEVGSVLDDDLLVSVDQFLNGEMSRAAIPAGDGTLSGETGRTEVYFWGMKRSGKTTVIGTLVAAQSESIQSLNTGASLSRAENMMYAYGETGCCALLPEVQDNENADCQVINLDVRGKNSRLHPLSLIEMKKMSADADVLKQTTNEKIHILCYDCTKADSEQDNAFISLLNELRAKNILHHSVGVYLLVTKTDTFANEQKQYREELAQSLITGEHSNLWITVKNLCCEMQISDATPIPYYIGDVKLKRLVKVDLTYARQLIEKPLILKSHPYRSFVGRTLMFGSWKLTMPLLALICAAVIFGVYKVIPGVGTMPADVMQPIDYVAQFRELENEYVKGKNCKDSNKAFAELENDLQTEGAIMLSNGRMLLKRRELRTLASELYDDYTESVVGGLRYETNGNWNEKAMLMLQEAAHNLLKINDSRYFSSSKREALREAVKPVDEYFEAKQLIDNSKNCTSESEVEHIKEEVQRYIEGPLADCQPIIEKLQEAVKTAEDSYEQYKKDHDGFRLSDILDWFR